MSEEKIKAEIQSKRIHNQLTKTANRMEKPMPECHTCPLNGKKSKRCITCAKRGGPPTHNHKGQVFVAVSFDLKQPDKDQTPELAVNRCCEDAVRRLVATFCDMNEHDLSLVFSMLRDQRVAVWARRHHRTHPAAFIRLRGIIKRHPELSFLHRNHKPMARVSK